MTTAFQSNAFQNNAYQIETVTPVFSGGGWVGTSRLMPEVIPVTDDTDDEFLMAWFMFMRQG